MISSKHGVLLTMEKNCSSRTVFTNSGGYSGTEGLGRTDTPNGGSRLCIVHRSASTARREGTFVSEASLIRGWSKRVYYAPAASIRVGKRPEGFDVGYGGQQLGEPRLAELRGDAF